MIYHSLPIWSIDLIGSIRPDGMRIFVGENAKPNIIRLVCPYFSTGWERLAPLSSLESARDADEDHAN